ncbi:acetoacetate decarboxylase family protein [Lactobacillus sp. ESL0791]|uniref:acetoacetate decarboxylase family protein n=1 Tax=Lactobacillus sp. ESL0791 TaxID=2983234 RepID=UPI0023F72891|nr:acetoacetate decarboxylase family protein [Lactobacillus sp. ESL0791]MDF7639416.1 acetoacetate decarboxylase family protein [Lactobacillus sp. ESL0791]
MSGFVVDKNAIENFSKNSDMKDEEGILFAYESDQAVLDEIIPKPLKVISPIVGGYVANIGKPTFSNPYLEEMLSVMVSYKDKVGAYPLQLLLYGAGAEAATIAGRESMGMPKKLADSIELTRTGNEAFAKVNRNGKTLIDLKWQAGQPNDSLFISALGGLVSTKQASDATSFFFKYVWNQREDTSAYLDNLELVAVNLHSVADKAQPGKLTIKLASTENDPLGELKVVKPLGATWYHYQTSAIGKYERLGRFDSDEIAPYLITSRFDHAFYDSQATSF